MRVTNHWLPWQKLSPEERRAPWLPELRVTEHSEDFVQKTASQNWRAPYALGPKERAPNWISWLIRGLSWTRLDFPRKGSGILSTQRLPIDLGPFKQAGFETPNHLRCLMEESGLPLKASGA